MSADRFRALFNDSGASYHEFRIVALEMRSIFCLFFISYDLMCATWIGCTLYNYVHFIPIMRKWSALCSRHSTINEQQSANMKCCSWALRACENPCKSELISSYGFTIEMMSCRKYFYCVSNNTKWRCKL